MEVRRTTACTGVSAVTVRATADGTSWEIADLYGPGGVVPATCRDIARAAADALRRQYDLLSEDELVPDDELRL